MKTFVHNINGSLFSATAEEALTPQIQTLFQILENIPSEKIRDGFSIEIGWTVFFLSLKDDTYFILAPDFQKDPFADQTEDLTLSLWVQLEQTHFLRLHNVTGESVRFSDKVIAAKQALTEDEITLQRFSDCSKGDSGWCIESLSNRECDEYEAYYAYQLLKHRPSLIKALALPFEYMVIFDRDNIKAIINENDENILDSE